MRVRSVVVLISSLLAISDCGVPNFKYLASDSAAACDRAFDEVFGATNKPDAASRLQHGRSQAWRILDLLETMA